MSKIEESFTWYREDVKPMSGEKVGNWVRFKGVALFPTVSRNQREYIERECELSARTLANVPIDINHAYDVWLAKKQMWEQENEGLSYESIEQPPAFSGNVIDAEWEDGKIEYVAQAKGEYGQKILDKFNLTHDEYVEKWGKEPIYGVSISATYRYPEEGEDMLTPRGIKFQRLSLVEDPEHPGVRGTSIELMETYNNQTLPELELVGNLIKIASPSLYESYRDEVIEPYREGKKLSKENYVASPVDEMRFNPHSNMIDYGEAHYNPDGSVSTEDKSEVNEKDVSIEETKKLAEAMSEEELKQKIADLQKSIDATWNYEAPTPSEEEKAKDDAKIEQRAKLEAEKTAYQEALNLLVASRALSESEKDKKQAKESDDDPSTLGEPFAGYKDFDACVAANSDKDDPEAYCASIKRKVEELHLEDVDLEILSEKPSLAKPTGDKDVDEAVAEVNKKRLEEYNTKRDTRLIEVLKKFEERQKNLEEHQNSLLNASDESMKCVGGKLAESRKGLKELRLKLEEKAGVDKVKKLSETIDEVSSKLGEVEKRFKDTDTEMLGLVESIAETHEALKPVIDIIGELQDREKQLEEKYGKLLTTAETLNTNNKKLVEQLVKLETAYETYKTSTETRLEKLSTLESEKTALQETLTETTSNHNAALEDFKTRIETLESEKKTIQETITETTNTYNKTLTEYATRLETLEKAVPEAEQQRQRILELEEQVETLQETQKPDYKGNQDTEPEDSSEIEANEDILDSNRARG